MNEFFVYCVHNDTVYKNCYIEATAIRLKKYYEENDIDHNTWYVKKTKTFYSDGILYLPLTKKNILEPTEEDIIEQRKIDTKREELEKLNTIFNNLINEIPVEDYNLLLKIKENYITNL